MAIREYIGARYVPRFRGTYDVTTVYEALDVVDNGLGTSYIAKVPTPAGTPLTNTTYWALYGAASGAIINLQNQIDTIDATLGDHTTGLVKSVDDAWTQIDNINNVALPNIDSQINNLIASMVEVAEGPHIYSGSADCSDNNIHVVGSFELEADKYYILEVSCQFEIAANSATGEHWLEMEITTNPAPTVFGRSRLYWCGNVLQYLPAAQARIASIHNAFIIKPQVDTTYYIAVRDYKSVSATVGAYPCIQALNFD